MRKTTCWIVAIFLALPACAQSESGARERPGLYDCEGCEAAAERSPDELDWRLTVPPEGEPGERLVLSGRVVQGDGKTPAPDVVLYFHQTNAEGIYPPPPGSSGWARRHGTLSGWLATDAEGHYEITTIRPGSYPGSRIPAHIHVYVKEPNRKPYYIDDFHFEGDPFLTSTQRNRANPRGGSGIVALKGDAQGGWRGEREIVLEP